MVWIWLIPGSIIIGAFLGIGFVELRFRWRRRRLKHQRVEYRRDVNGTLHGADDFELGLRERRRLVQRELDRLRR